MGRRSNLLVVIGLVAFVLGLLAVYLITSDDDDGGGGGTAGADTVEVLVAAESLAAGKLGEDILRDQLYRVEEVSIAERHPDALVTPSQLSGAVLTLSFAEGEQLRSEGIRSLGGSRAQIPEGREAVSISVDFVAGGANSIIPGDRVNVFLVLSGALATTAVTDDGAQTAAPPPFRAPRTELLLTNTLVLDVQQGTSPLQVSQPQTGSGQPAAGSAGSLIVVLAVDTIDAEKVIFAANTTGTELYLSRVRVDEENNPSPPVDSTPGVDFGTVLAEEAGAAFRRSDG